MYARTNHQNSQAWQYPNRRFPLSRHRTKPCRARPPLHPPHKTILNDEHAQLTKINGKELHPIENNHFPHVVSRGISILFALENARPVASEQPEHRTVYVLTPSMQPGQQGQPGRKGYGNPIPACRPMVTPPACPSVCVVGRLPLIFLVLLVLFRGGLRQERQVTQWVFPPSLARGTLAPCPIPPAAATATTTTGTTATASTAAVAETTTPRARWLPAGQRHARLHVGLTRVRPAAESSSPVLAWPVVV